MGGSGSGRWRQHTKATTVESCFVISIKALRKAGVLAAPYKTMHATITRTLAGMVIEQIELRVHPTIPLVLDLDRLRLEVELEERACRYGGRSWWLLCPGCCQRCLKLFLPEGAASHPAPFRCRLCWGLTYQAAQEAHYWDRGVCANPKLAELLRIQRALRVLENHPTRRARLRALRLVLTERP